MSNGFKFGEFFREIDCNSVNVIYYLKCKICNKKETYIVKTIGDNTKGFEVVINHTFLIKKQRFQHVSSHIMCTTVVLKIIVYKNHF